MALKKLLKTGSLVLTGTLLGGLLAYNSQKPEIVQGIDDIKTMAIDAKDEARNLTTQKESLEREIIELNNTLELEQDSLRNPLPICRR